MESDVLLVLLVSAASYTHERTLIACHSTLSHKPAEILIDKVTGTVDLAN